MYVCMYKGWAIKSSPCTATFNELLCLRYIFQFHNTQIYLVLQTTDGKKILSANDEYSVPGSCSVYTKLNYLFSSMLPMIAYKLGHQDGVWLSHLPEIKAEETNYSHI
jgi:hypothetical protein